MMTLPVSSWKLVSASHFLTVDDKPAILNTLKNHHGIVEVKAEVDQFCEGLVTLGVLDCIKRFPDVMQPLFMDINPIQITKGKCVQWDCFLYFLYNY